jgi:hypothetical protein
MNDLSWPHLKNGSPTADERALRVLNLIFGNVEHSPFAVDAIAKEIRDAMRETAEAADAFIKGCMV